jgi:hypothetical protein
MDTNKIDEVFKNIIDNNNNEYYQSKALDSKERIWNKLKMANPNSDRRALLIKILAAASIILLFISSILFYNLKHEYKRNQSLANYYTTKLKNLNTNLIIQKDTIYIQKYLHDTIVKIEKREKIKVEYLTQNIHIVDTVYKTDTVFKIIDKSVDFNITKNINEGKSFEIQSFENTKRPVVKNKKFALRFGGNNNDLEDTRLAFKHE